MKRLITSTLFLFVAQCFAANLPTLENVEVFHWKLPGKKWKPTLFFKACRETQESDWTLSYKVESVGNDGTKIGVLTLTPVKPLQCQNKFAGNYQGVSIDLEAKYPDLVGLTKYIVTNPSEIKVEYDED